ECDDGNDIAHDGCSPACIKEYVCGDGECTTLEGESCQNCQIDCCPACGNGIRQLGENCDTNELNNLSCQDFGYTGGNLTCTAWCDFNLSGCIGTGPVCGNDTAEYGEECDGTDMNSQDCLSLGFLGGLAFCGSDCRFNTSGCQNQVRWFYEDFDSVLLPAGWQFSYPFEWGSPSNVGPSSAFSGSSCAGTNLSSNAPDDASYDTSYFITPPIDLSEATAPVLYFWAWFSMDTSTYDYDEWRVEYSLNGTTWTLITDMDPSYNNSNGQAYEMFTGANSWSPYVANVQSLGGNSTVFFRFSAQFDHYTDVPGLYIDNVMVVEGAQIPITLTTESVLGKAVVAFPFSRTLDVWGGSGDINYSFVGSHPAWLNLNPSTGELSGTPSIADLANVVVTVRAMDNQNPINVDQKDFTIYVLDAIYYQDFEGGALPAGWTITGAVFEFGTPTGTQSPSACASGSYCIGTGMNVQYISGMTWGNHCVTTGNIDLTSAGAATLSFSGWRYTETSYDGAICEVELNGSGTWDDSSTHTPAYNEDNGSRMTWSGQQQSWENFEVDLTPYVGNTAKIRWCFYSDGSVTYPGWFIDDVMILGN
ncbi:immune inhibitor A, partial [Myxococcota bacterium]|nr:immune inhibitor A [Myxococcota bacterium]